MDTLLTSKFIAHYTLTAPGVSAPFKETNAKYFELKDDATLIYYNLGEGVAPHKNDSDFHVKIINYEAFHIGLPQVFKDGKKICDLIVYTSQINNYFSLNELTDTDPIYIVDFTNTTGSKVGKRNKAIEQLHNTLTLLIAVPDIKAFADSFITRRCCFFNKRVTPPLTAPVIVTAPTTFSRINTIAEEGFEMSHSGIEGLGFKLYEYSGGIAAKIV